MSQPPMSIVTRNPYPGLRPFEVDEFESFFGRDRQIDELLGRLRDHRFVAVVGLSGSGKSSLVRAGLIHKLQVGHLTSAGSSWRIALFRPGPEPIEALATALDDTLGKQRDRAAQLRKSTQELLNSTREARGPKENLLLVVDQFEEIFRFQSNKELSGRDATHFVGLLLAAEQDLSPDYRVYVVLTMRTDYLGDCAQFDGLPEALNHGQYLVPRFTKEQMAEAIEGPAALVDTQVTAELLQTLLVETAEGRDSLPLLQHALTRLWERRESTIGGWQIASTQYQALGGMAKALNDYSDRVLAELPPDRQELAKKIFQELTEVGQGRDQRRPQRVGQLAQRTGTTLSEAAAVVEHFLKATLLTSPDRGHAQDWEVDITHESLIRQWDTLANWAKEQAKDRDDYLYFASRVGRGGELLTGRDLALALKWRDRNHRSDWGERYGGDFADTLAFIERSRKRLLIKSIFLGSVAWAALLLSVVFLFIRYRQHLSKIAKEEAANARQQGIQEGLETLPIETLDQAIADAERRNDPALTSLRNARQYYVASLNLVAVAMNGAILSSGNGGNSWQALHINTGVDLWSVTFASPRSGWATGEKGTILHTEDGGRSWHKQTSGTTVELNAISFSDERSGWATGEGGTILHTEDGGRTWQKQTSGTKAWLLCLSFVNPQSVWSGGSGGTILRTVDGGNSWQKSNPTNKWLRSLTFVTLQSGWAVGYDGTILHTEDGGKNWQSQTGGTNARLYGIAFVSQQSGWVVGQSGTILHTEDGGRHWRAQSSSTNAELPNLHAVSFLTSRSGWAAGDQGTILYTEDGGNSWRKQNSPTHASLLSITFVGQR